MTELLALIAVPLLVVVIFLSVRYLSLQKTMSELQGQIQQRAQEQYQAWRERECESIRLQQMDIAQREAVTSLQQWKYESEVSIRHDAIQRSQSVIIGKVSEHLLPYMPKFAFNPKDVRFIGSPIDLIIFNGMDEGDVHDIVFVEVKTGASAALTKRERQIRDVINAGRVKWTEMRINREA
ncbi:MAG TPA: Holliday junction resolvase-like protein [Nitrososphaera sp.]|nr:Holliday junction resolvase-like protein [Nitrososphaera sp.]